jgi:hypothetical protein
MFHGGFWKYLWRIVSHCGGFVASRPLYKSLISHVNTQQSIAAFLTLFFENTAQKLPSETVKQPYIYQSVSAAGDLFVTLLGSRGALR